MEYADYINLKNKRKRPAHEETDIQIRLVEWMTVSYPDLIFTCTTAGLNLPIKHAVRLKRMGLRKNFPDLTIFKARMGYNGLLIEIKKISGDWKKNQQDMARRLTDEGYKSVCGYGFEECQTIIKNYLESSL